MYQGRFKSFPVQEDEHFYALCRYVERNALRANLARRAERWRWGQPSSLEAPNGEGEGGVGGLAVAALAGLGRARQRPVSDAELAALRQPRADSFDAERR